MSCSNPRNVYDDGAKTCLTGPVNDILNQLDYDYIDEGHLKGRISECEADQYCFYKTTKEMVKRGSSKSKFGENNDDFWYFSVDRGCISGGSENAERFLNDCENEELTENCRICEGDRCNLDLTCNSNRNIYSLLGFLVFLFFK